MSAGPEKQNNGHTVSTIVMDPVADPDLPAVDKEEVFFASIEPGLDTPLPASCSALAKSILEYEEKSKQPVWVIIQSDSGGEALDMISEELAAAIVGAASQIEPGKKISLILHTFGGDPHSAYRIATFLQKRAGGFDAVIPKIAKSAGTLITLGASKILFAPMAELGPLDMQVKDEEADIWDSALNETKALQTLSREALVLYVEKMELLNKLYRRKRFETKSRIATDFVNEMIRPLVEKIDAVHYTKMARIMEIMKKYGRELMTRAGYSRSQANKAVDALGDGFPDHSYIIDSREAKELGLRAETLKTDLSCCVDNMCVDCGDVTIVGKITSSLKLK